MKEAGTLILLGRFFGTKSVFNLPQNAFSVDIRGRVVHAMLVLRRVNVKPIVTPERVERLRSRLRMKYSQFQLLFTEIGECFEDLFLHFGSTRLHF